MALALLLFGMPVGAACGPVATGGQADGAAGQIWFSSGLETPAAPQTGASREAPEVSAVAAPGGSAIVLGLEPERIASRATAALGSSTPLYLSHCAFLC